MSQAITRVLSIRAQGFIGMPPRFFDDPALARGEGLIALGGQLSTERLLDGYRHGIFPWPSGNLLAWWSPDPRAVIEFGDLHVSRSLARTIRRDKFTVTSDVDFVGVLNGCATAPDRRGGTWLNADMRRAYAELHRQGWAHSVEAWHNGELAGGVYGVSLGGVFFAESMFRRVRDASKVALVALVRHLAGRGYAMLDIQQWTPHTGSLGATEMPRREFLRRLAEARDKPISFGQAGADG